MDPQLAEVIDLLRILLPMAAIIVAVAVGGSLLNNWLKIKNGYPLSNSWGMPMHPKKNEEALERIKLLKLARDIDALAIDKGGNA